MAENFRIQGGITFPDGTEQTTAYTGDGGPIAAETYKGFKAVYGRMYNDSDDLPDGHNITKIVIYKDTVSPTASVGTAIADDTDYFRVTGLTGSDFVGLFNYYGATSTPPEVAAIKLFTKSLIDNVILVDGVEGDLNSVLGMKIDFTSNFSTFSALAGDLVTDFEFYNTQYVNIPTSKVEGNGISFTVRNNEDGTYSTQSIGSGGTNYVIGHKILINGSSLGGVTGVNDAIATVASVSSGGVITALTYTGTSTGAGQNYSSLNISNYEVGSGLRITFNYNFDTDSIFNDNRENDGTLYVIGDIVNVSGTDVNGASPANDMVFRVTSVYDNGKVNGYELVSGTPVIQFPENSISDGGDDQYDSNANYIYTNLEGDTYTAEDNIASSIGALPYDNGNVSDGTTWFGVDSEYAVLYNDSIFGVVATGVAIDWIGTNGASGWDNSGNADAGEVFDPAPSITITATDITLTNDGFFVDQFVGPEVVFAKSNNGNEIDIIDTDVQITRDNNQGPYNPAVDNEYNNGIIANTEWNADGWNTLSDITTRTYFSTARDAFEDWGNGSGEDQWPYLVGHEFIMHDTENDKYYTFKFTNWQIGNNGGGMGYVRREINLDAYFTKTDNGDEIDDFGNGTQITRDIQNSIYNPDDEGSYDEDVSPGGTLWNLDGWDDLSNVTARSYVVFYSAVTGDHEGIGNIIVGRELVMYDTNNNEYYAIKFLQWTQGSNGGGFQYYRRKIDKNNLDVGIKFADGTRQTTAYLPNKDKIKIWNNPNGSTWRIIEYSGGSAVTYEGDNIPAVWWDAANSPEGEGGFRGAIVEYHAFCDNGGTIIGTIHVANDDQWTATHTEAASGDSNISNYIFWDRNTSRTSLGVRRVASDSGSSDDQIYVQWTSRVFYGREYYC
jgi:hypothetical protein